MATAKKRTTTKKPVARKSATARTTSRSTGTTKNKRRPQASAKRSGSRGVSRSVKSFRVTKSDRKFNSWKPDIQAVYWIILAIPVIGLALWVSSINMQVQDIYDQIDEANAESNAALMLKKASQNTTGSEAVTTEDQAVAE